MTVDAERLVSAYLRAQGPVTAIVGDRVYTDLPSRPAFPLVRLTLIGGAPRFSWPLYLDEAVLQIDCYGGPKVLARQLVDIIRSLLATEAFCSAHDRGVVSSVAFGPLSYIPDEFFEPPKPRYIAEATLVTHPIGGTDGP